MSGGFVGYKVITGPLSKNINEFSMFCFNASKSKTSHASLVFLNGVLSLYQMKLAGRCGYCMMIQWCRRRFTVGISVQVSIWNKKGFPFLLKFTKQMFISGSTWSITWGVGVLWYDSVENIGGKCEGVLVFTRCFINILVIVCYLWGVWGRIIYLKN